MKRPPPGMTVDQLAAQLRRSGLLSDAAVRAVEEHWQREAGDTADAARFARWLIVRGYLTDAQLAVLLRPPDDAAEGLGPIMSAVIVAAPAGPRPIRAAVPTAAAAPPGLDIDVELVPAAPVELPPADELAEIPIAPTRPAAPARPAGRAPNVWLFMLLGALGLLVVQCLGWMLAQLLFL